MVLLQGSNKVDQTAASPDNKEVLGRVLGPARGTGNEMAQWILKPNGRVVPRRSIMLEDEAATRQTSRQTDVFVSMFLCSSDARS